MRPRYFESEPDFRPIHTTFERLLSKSLTTLEVMAYYLVVHTGPGREPLKCLATFQVNQRKTGGTRTPPALTFLLDSSRVDGYEAAPSSVPGPQNVLADVPGDARERSGDKAEGSAGLHHRARTARLDGQAVGGAQVASQMGLQLKLLQPYTGNISFTRMWKLLLLPSLLYLWGSPFWVRFLRL